MITNALFVFLGGGLGSLARFGVGQVVFTYFRTQLPLATLLANALSCVVFALAAVHFQAKPDSALRLLILVGFCGGFSTFSTFSFETLELLRAGQWIFAAGNVVLSILVCVAILYFLSKSQV